MKTLQENELKTIGDVNQNTLILGDCLNVMPYIAAGSIDAIITDLPYGTTACKWDEIIPFEPMWAAVKRVLKPRGVFVTTASQPFTSKLVMSNLAWFKYEWVWNKSKASNFAQAKNNPLRTHENICVFSLSAIGHEKQTKNRMIYNPQGVDRTPKLWTARNARRAEDKIGHNFARKGELVDRIQEGSGYPKSVLFFGSVHNPEFHPTQKPVALLEYLIRTYTNEGNTVLDICAGSGTTGVAAINTKRNYILIEKDPTYFKTIQERIAKALSQPQFPIA